MVHKLQTAKCSNIELRLRTKKEERVYVATYAIPSFVGMQCLNCAYIVLITIFTHSPKQPGDHISKRTTICSVPVQHSDPHVYFIQYNWYISPCVRRVEHSAGEARQTPKPCICGALALVIFLHAIQVFLCNRIAEFLISLALFT